VFHKQSELISLETMMSARLKEAVSSNEKLTETISSLNAELRTYYEKMKELERQKLVLETASLREREASELKIRALEDRSKEKDAVIDAVRKDF
jgi:predicted nuclease with TOPRIM domain